MRRRKLVISAALAALALAVLWAGGERGPVTVTLNGAETPVTLAEDEYFLLGDNREGSEDSRFVNIGNVKRDQIQGKVWLRLMPLLDIGLIE